VTSRERPRHRGRSVSRSSYGTRRCPPPATSLDRQSRRPDSGGDLRHRPPPTPPRPRPAAARPPTTPPAPTPASRPTTPTETSPIQVVVSASSSATALPNLPVLNQGGPLRGPRAPGVRRGRRSRRAPIAEQERRAGRDDASGPGQDESTQDGQGPRRSSRPASAPERVQCWSGYGPAASSSGGACCLTHPSALPSWPLIGWRRLLWAEGPRRRRSSAFVERRRDARGSPALSSWTCPDTESSRRWTCRAAGVAG
jgi:hypothetical protein